MKHINFDCFFTGEVKGGQDSIGVHPQKITAGSAKNHQTKMKRESLESEPSTSITLGENSLIFPGQKTSF